MGSHWANISRVADSGKKDLQRKKRCHYSRREFEKKGGKELHMGGEGSGKRGSIRNNLDQNRFLKRTYFFGCWW